jgi:hypothetical protein
MIARLFPQAGDRAFNLGEPSVDGRQGGQHRRGLTVLTRSHASA